MEDLFIPTLHTFENNNIFTGSYGLLRFKITPEITMKTPKEVDMDASSMKVVCWLGLYRYEISLLEGERIFPLSTQGREDMILWLKEQV